MPSGTYEHREAQIVAQTNEAAPVSVSLTAYIGGFFGGDRARLRPSLNLRAGETFTASLDWDRNDINLTGGEFVTNIGRARVSYSFSPRMFVQGLVQYNDHADLWSSNLRFGLLSEANTGLFIVYNDTRGLGDIAPIPKPAGIIPGLRDPSSLDR